MTLTPPQDVATGVALLALADATDRLLSTVDDLSAEDFARPSVLPGWSRAHVLAHLALNAKGLAGVLTTVGSPAPLPLYASDDRRDADIERLAAAPAARIADRLAVGAAVLAGHLGGGPTPEQALEAVGRAGLLHADLAQAAHRHDDAPPPGADSNRGADAGSRASAAGPGAAGEPGTHDPIPAAGQHGVIPPFVSAARQATAAGDDGLPPLAGTFERTPGGRAMAIADVPLMRWREVEIHHADLAAGYRPDDWPDLFTDYLLAVLARDRGPEIDVTLRTGTGEDIVIGGGNMIIDGSRPAFAWWLLGRGDGEGLRCAEPGSGLPTLGPWMRRP